MSATPEEVNVAANGVDQQRLRKGRVPADTFSNRLMLARALAGHVSIREACVITGLNRGNWTGWERGLRPRDILDVCQRISAALDVDEEWLLFGGPLEGPRGRPVTERTKGPTIGYQPSPIGPTNNRPKVRGHSSSSMSGPPGPGGSRRPVRVGRAVLPMPSDIE